MNRFLLLLFILVVSCEKPTEKKSKVLSEGTPESGGFSPARGVGSDAGGRFVGWRGDSLRFGHAPGAVVGVARRDFSRLRPDRC